MILFLSSAIKVRNFCIKICYFLASRAVQVAYKVLRLFCSFTKSEIGLLDVAALVVKSPYPRYED